MKPARCLARITAATAAIAVAAGCGPALASAGWHRSAGGPAVAIRPGGSGATSGPTGRNLSAVASVSGRLAWAVGDLVYPRRQTGVVLRRAGGAWHRTRIPALPGWTILYDVTATSARSAWAVGSDQLETRGVLLHWNGTTWKQAATGLLRGVGTLDSVTALSPRRAWAAGTGRHGRPVILSWNGRAWHHAYTGPATGQMLSIAAGSARSAWAVGYLRAARGRVTGLALHWNGTTWHRTSLPARTLALHGVTAASPRAAWAVGGTTTHAPILRWTSHGWTRPAQPRLTGGYLGAISARSPRDVWAVGNNAAYQPEALHFNGTTWQRVTVPAVPGAGVLYGLATARNGRAWAVGQAGPHLGGAITDTWNGHTWSTTPWR